MEHGTMPAYLDHMNGMLWVEQQQPRNTLCLQLQSLLFEKLFKIHWKRNALSL